MKELVFPWPLRELSPNARVHWSVRAAAAKSARRMGWAIAEAANGYPKRLFTGKIHLWIDFYPPTRRLPDDDNMLARFKAYRDGIADALGVDDSRFVSHPYVKDEVRKGGEVRVRITGGPDE